MVEQLQTFSETILATGSEELALWLSSQAALAVTGAPKDMLVQWVQLSESLSADLPALAVKFESFSEHGTLSEGEAEAILRASGYYKLELRHTSAAFRPVWAYPVWSILELNVSAESQQILESLRGLLQVHFLTTSPGMVVEVDHDCTRAQLRIMFRKWYLSSKAILQEFFALRGVGLFWHVLGCSSSLQCEPSFVQSATTCTS